MSVSLKTVAYWQTDTGETQLPCTMHYDTNDPFAVAFVLHCSSDITWVFARELLEEGLGGIAGAGDVRIGRVGDMLDLALSSPDGSAVYRYHAPRLEEFLKLTFEQVPRGAESFYIDWEALLPPS